MRPEDLGSYIARNYGAIYAESPGLSHENAWLTFALFFAFLALYLKDFTFTLYVADIVPESEKQSSVYDIFFFSMRIMGVE